MRIVLKDSREVAHFWANKTQPQAKCSNMFFEGDTIYSYGHHFPIARHAKTKAGHDCVLFTTRGYSSTTAKHTSFVRQALRGDVPVFYVTNPLASCGKEHLENFVCFEEQAKQKRELFATARLAVTRAAAAENLETLVRAANTYAKAFGLRNRLKVGLTPKDVAALKAARAKKEQTAREAAQRLIERSAAVMEAWRNNDPEVKSLPSGLPVCLRVRQSGLGGTTSYTEELETSLGVRVPLEAARKVFVVVSLCRRKGQAWHRNGEQLPVGDFQIDSISETGNVVAGCHRIYWDEIERFAKSQGWTK